MVNYLSLAKKEANKRSFGSHSYYSYNSPWLAGLEAHEDLVVEFLMADTPGRICNLLEIQFLNLQQLINDPQYISFKVPKKKGGTRDIFAPDGLLKEIQRKLNTYLQAYYLCIKPSEVHGFVIHPKSSGVNYCNIVENAKIHTQKQYVLNIDLKDFFPSISSFRVKELFTSSLFGFSDAIATAYTLLTTYEGKLPIGAPTSPVISNFVCRQLDADLIAFAAAQGLAYTRYADDLTFSSNSKIESDCLLGIREIIQRNDFQVNEKKFRLQTTNRKQTVTGITVNEKVNVDRKLLKKIRAMLHDWSHNGIAKATLHHFPSYFLPPSFFYPLTLSLAISLVIPPQSTML